MISYKMSTIRTTLPMQRANIKLLNVFGHTEEGTIFEKWNYL